MAKVDDEMLRHYCNEDLFLMEVQPRDTDSYDLTLIELQGVEHWATPVSVNWILEAEKENEVSKSHVKTFP